MAFYRFAAGAQCWTFDSPLASGTIFVALMHSVAAPGVQRPASSSFKSHGARATEETGPAPSEIRRACPCHPKERKLKRYGQPCPGRRLGSTKYSPDLEILSLRPGYLAARVPPIGNASTPAVAGGLPAMNKFSSASPAQSARNGVVCCSAVQLPGCSVPVVAHVAGAHAFTQPAAFTASVMKQDG